MSRARGVVALISLAFLAGLLVVACPAGPRPGPGDPNETDATLRALIISEGTLAPPFAATTFEYTANVASTVEMITITPTATQSRATLTVSVTEGDMTREVPPATARGYAIALAEGRNTITITVTAPNGTTTQYYTLQVNRALIATDATLSGLTLSSGVLVPAFMPATTDYNVSVASSVTSITLTPTTTQGAATVRVNGRDATSDRESDPIMLATDSTAIPIVVTSPNGAVMQTYTVTVRKSTATLSALTLQHGATSIDITPDFSPVITSYRAQVENNVMSLTVTPTATIDGSIITVGGTTVASNTSSDPIIIAEGPNNIIDIEVRMGSGIPLRYQIQVARDAKYTCTNGMAVDETTDVPNIMRCASCAEGYSRTDELTCTTSQPYICAQGTASTVVDATVDGLSRCVSCTGLYTLDGATDTIGTTCRMLAVGEARQVGPLVNENDPYGLAALNGTLYMVGNQHDALYTINIDPNDMVPDGTATRVNTMVSQFGVTEDLPRGLAAIQSTTTLYMVGDQHDMLYTINIDPDDMTPDSTAIPVGSLGVNGLGALGAIQSTTTLYMTAIGPFSSHLYTLNITPGDGTPDGMAIRAGDGSAPAGFGLGVTFGYGLAAVGDTLYGAGPSLFYRFTIATGGAIQVGSDDIRAFSVGELNPRDLAAIGTTLYMVGNKNDAFYVLRYQ